MKTMASILERREFFRLVGGTLILIPAGLFLVRSAGGGEQGQGGPINQPSLQGTKLIYTSSVAGGHTHTFGIEMAAIDRPPADGVSGPSGVAEGHSHNVIVSAAQLSSISAGQTVQVTSGRAGGHAHLFTFLKLA
jgi:hypothetical protein